MHVVNAAVNGNRIAECRKRAGLKREHIAARLNVNASTVFRWEKGKPIPSDKLQQVAEYLDVPPAYLMGWDER